MNLDDPETIDAAVALASSIPAYERNSFIICNATKFLGKNIEEWISEIELPHLEDDLSITELENFNHAYFNISEVIMSNLSRARASFSYSNIYYRDKLNSAKSNVLRSIAADNADPNKPNRRTPGKESLEETAKSHCMDAWTSYKVAEMWRDFWVDHYEKIRLSNYRLTNMNTLRNIESKIG